MSAATLTAIIKAAANILVNERSRKTVGWIIAAILSPLIVLVVLICAIFSGTAEQNVSVVELCFHGGTIPAEVPAEYRDYIEEMRSSFTQLDDMIGEVNEQLPEGNGLDSIRVKAMFYALYFGGAQPDDEGLRAFVDCFVTGPDGSPAPVPDPETAWANIQTAMGVTATEAQRSNAESIYNLVRYGSAGGTAGWMPGAEVPFIGADGFCSPIGSGWESRVTSEFGNRIDPITGQRRGHTGMDLAVPTGTPIRAALPGTVTVSQYNAGGYGYYVMIDHGGGLATLYGHNSKLLARVGQTVAAGDIIALSGSTGRSTGPHLHFEVRVNGERTNPRYYLPRTGG